jgi:hypothetical protein
MGTNGFIFIARAAAGTHCAQDGAVGVFDQYGARLGQKFAA